MDRLIENRDSKPSEQIKSVSGKSVSILSIGKDIESIASGNPELFNYTFEQLIELFKKVRNYTGS